MKPSLHGWSMAHQNPEECLHMQAIKKMKAIVATVLAYGMVTRTFTTSRDFDEDLICV
jgi:hypothetical protein